MKNWFNPTPANLEELKKMYRELAKTYHPDVNPQGLEAMKDINRQYDILFAELPKTKQEENEQPEEFKDIINAIINLNVTIEICGTWVWVSGNTKPVKEIIKTAGFKWAPKKQNWYWHPEQYSRKWKKHYSMEDIRRMHGSTTIKEQKESQRVTA